jgi:Lysylphosphatidylglycerol synthase TM region
MKRFNLILFLLGAGFLVWLVWNIGAAELWREMRLLGWGLIPFMLGEGAAEMIHTVGWRHCLTEPWRSLPWRRLFRIRMAGYAINYLTPTACVGGEATRIALLASDHRGPGAVSGVLIEKVCFALAQIIFVAIGLVAVVRWVQLPGPLWVSMLASGGLMAGGVTAFLILQRRGKLGGMVRWLAVRRPGSAALKKAAENITSVDEALRAFFRERPGEMWKAVGWHLAGFCVGFMQTWFFFHLLKLDASWRAAAVVWFLSMWFDVLTFAVPLNVGSLEGSRIVAFKAAGYGVLPGMSYGLAIRLAMMFWAGIGLALYYPLAMRNNQREQSSSPNKTPLETAGDGVAVRPTHQA